MIGKIDDRRKQKRGGRLGFAAVLATLNAILKAKEGDGIGADPFEPEGDVEPQLEIGPALLPRSRELLEVMVDDINRTEVVDERVYRLRHEDWIWPS